MHICLRTVLAVDMLTYITALVVVSGRSCELELPLFVGILHQTLLLYADLMSHSSVLKSLLHI